MNNQEYIFPRINRARGYYVYDNHGNRYLDMYQENGKALLGHRPKQFSTAMKNTLEKGLYAGYPGDWEQKLFSALAVVLPEYSSFLVFGNALDAHNHLLTSGPLSGRYPDPLTDDITHASFSMWRPFLEADYPDVIVPLLPFPGSMAPVVVALKTGTESATIRVSPVAAAGLSRICHNLAAYVQSNPYGQFQEGWKGWTVKGPYLMFEGTREQYLIMRNKMLHSRVLLPPEYTGYAIMPAELPGDSLHKLQKEMRLGDGT